MVVDVKKKIKVRTPEKDRMIGYTLEFYDCDEDEYVVAGEIFRKTYTTKTIDSQEIYCPVCEKHVESSDYLRSVFPNDKEFWLANIITHMRHTNHAKNKIGQQSSYDKTWGRGGYGWNKLQTETHDSIKKQQNEVEKRRLAKDERFRNFLIQHEFKADDIMILQNTTEDTLTTWKKYLK